MDWLLLAVGAWIYLNIINYKYHAALSLSVGEKPREHPKWWTPIAQWFFSSVFAGLGAVLIAGAQTPFAIAWTIYGFMLFTYVSADMLFKIFKRILNPR